MVSFHATGAPVLRVAAKHAPVSATAPPAEIVDRTRNRNLQPGDVIRVAASRLAAASAADQPRARRHAERAQPGRPWSSPGRTGRHAEPRSCATKRTRSPGINARAGHAAGRHDNLRVADDLPATGPLAG